jgi:hypothetical protein
MEVRDYLRAIRRILWLVIAIPIVAGLLVGGFIELQPSSYQADASAVVPAITATGISQSAASQYTSTFKDVLTSNQVIPVVSQKFNIPQSELLTGLTSSTATASSNLINVVLTGKKGQDLVGAVREATVDAMNAIAAPQLVKAQNEVINAQTLLTQAQTGINNFDASYGNASPLVLYNSEQSTLIQQEAQLQTAIINNDQAHVNSLNATIPKTKATLAQYGQELQLYQPLAAALSAATTANAHAASDLVAVKSLIQTDSAPGTVTTKDVGRLSKLSDTIKFAAIGFALALLMMLGLILILELMRGGKRPQAAVEAGQQQGAFAWPPPSAQTRPAGPPATPAMAGTSAAAAARDPWRATDSSSATVVDGNGNGNGYDSGDAPASVPAAETDPQRAGLFRRR